MYIHTLVDKPLWDLSCDIAVEEVINGLGLPDTAAKRQGQQLAELNRLRGKVKQLTAEKLYRYFQDHPPRNPEKLRALFWGDDHDPWYLPPEDSEDGGGQEQDNRNGKSSSAAMEQTWKDISRRMQLDLETFSKLQGDRAGALTQNLQAVNRERYDYTAFLKKFAVPEEVMRLDPDEFDYVYYTYGLKLYKNMPLIEPLEYREVKRIREFVVAIDTSGSVAGELVQKFVQKTYNTRREHICNPKRIFLICKTAIKMMKKLYTRRKICDIMRGVESMDDLREIPFRKFIRKERRAIDEA